MDRCTMCREHKLDVQVASVEYRIQLCDDCAEKLLFELAERVALHDAEMEVWND
jgi:hypothetical protein